MDDIYFDNPNPDDDDYGWTEMTYDDCADIHNGCRDVYYDMEWWYQQQMQDWGDEDYYDLKEE